METSRITEILDAAWGNPHGEFALAPSVLFVAAPDDSGRIFDLDDSFYAVEATGVTMLRRAVSEDRETTVRVLARQFGVEASRIGQDYDTFFDDLERRRLVCRRGTRPTSASRWRTSPRLLPAVIGLVCRLPLRIQAWMLLAIARISIAAFGWNDTRRAWLRYAGPSPAVRGTAQGEIGQVVRRSAARHLLGANCKERSLCCLALCRAAGIPASLVLAISLFPLASHVWCETETAILTDFADRCEGYTPVVTYA